MTKNVLKGTLNPIQNNALNVYIYMYILRTYEIWRHVFTDTYMEFNIISENVDHMHMPESTWPFIGVKYLQFNSWFMPETSFLE